MWRLEGDAERWQERAEGANARLAAWEPVVRAAVAWRAGQRPNMADIDALQAAVHNLPPEMRPKGDAP